MAKPLKREVDALCAAYQRAVTEWGENNMETERRWMAWKDAQRAREAGQVVRDAQILQTPGRAPWDAGDVSDG